MLAAVQLTCDSLPCTAASLTKWRSRLPIGRGGLWAQRRPPIGGGGDGRWKALPDWSRTGCQISTLIFTRFKVPAALCPFPARSLPLPCPLPCPPGSRQQAGQRQPPPFSSPPPPPPLGAAAAAGPPTPGRPARMPRRFRFAQRSWRWRVRAANHREGESPGVWGFSPRLLAFLLLPSKAVKRQQDCKLLGAGIAPGNYAVGIIEEVKKSLAQTPLLFA